MKSFTQRGFSTIAVLVLVVIVVVVAVGGYRVVHNPSLDDSSPTTAATTSVPATIKNKADVAAAGKALDNLSIDNSVNPDQLDSDLNSLL
jgi:hypothetical protein